MELQKALGICLLTFFSATLVVLIARALDNQAARRLEPQLARIADQLEAIRAGGGLSTRLAAGPDASVTGDGLIVYYFYSNTRCPTCRAIETQTIEVLERDFASQLDSGEVVWKTLNYEEDRNASWMKKFEIVMPVVVLVRMQDQAIADWKRLDQVWGLVSDQAAFAKMIREQVGGMLEGPDEGLDGGPAQEVPPSVPAETESTDDIPMPTPTSDIPIPE